MLPAVAGNAERSVSRRDKDEMTSRIPMADYETCRRYARNFVNITNNLRFLRKRWMDEFGITEADLLRWKRERERMPHHEFPPPQRNAETCIRGKLAGYRAHGRGGQG